MRKFKTTSYESLYVFVSTPFVEQGDTIQCDFRLTRKQAKAIKKSAKEAGLKLKLNRGFWKSRIEVE